MRQPVKITVVLGIALPLGILAPSVSRAQDGVQPILLTGQPSLKTFPQQRVRPGRDRFNNSPALTNDELVAALNTNKTFRNNLARHFGMPAERIVAFVQDALVPQVLSRDTRVLNYGVTKSGSIYSKRTLLRKGTRVWATRDGKPILKWDCSNPLLPKIPLLREKPRPSSISRLNTSGVLSPQAGLQSPADLTALPVSTLAMLPPTATPPIPVIIGEIEPNPSTVPPVRNLARAGLPLLPLAGVVGLVVRSKTPPSTIPEPATLALFTLGLGAASALLRRRN